MTPRSPRARRAIATGACARTILVRGILAAATLSVALLVLPGRTARADDAAGATDPRTLFAAGRFDAARDAARAALAKDPTDANAARILQDALLAMGDAQGAAAVAPKGAPELLLQGLAARLEEPKAAIKALTPLTKADGAPAWLRLDLARKQLEKDTPSAAEAIANAYLKDRPDSAEGSSVLGAALAARGKTVTARDVYQRALEIEPGHAASAIGLADVLVEREQPEDAAAVLKAALGVHPHHPHLLVAHATHQSAAGEHDAALRTLTAVLALPVPKADVHALMAEVNRAKKDYKAAEACAAKALELDKEHVRALRVRGFVKFKRDDHAGALADYGTVATLRPDDAQIHADMALVHIMTGKLKDAEAAAKQALKLDKKLLDGHLRMGQVQYLNGKGKNAKKSFNAVLKQDKNHLLVNRYLGYVLLDEGKPKSALKHFQIVADALAKDSSSMRMVGRCQLGMGKVDDAVTSFREAVARNGQDGWAYFDLGKGLERQEKWDDAIAAYQKSIEVDGKLAYPHLYLAELLDEVQGEPEQALPHYKAYLELGGHDEGKAIEKRVKQLENP